MLQNATIWRKLSHKDEDIKKDKNFSKGKKLILLTLIY